MTESMLPAGSLNHAISGPRPREMARPRRSRAESLLEAEELPLGGRELLVRQPALRMHLGQIVELLDIAGGGAGKAAWVRPATAGGQDGCQQPDEQHTDHDATDQPEE